MNRKIGLSSCVLLALFLAAAVASALLTASDVTSSDISLVDVNNDGLVDVINSNGEIFWNQGDNQFSSNEMIITDHNLTKGGMSSYYAHQDPINATSLDYKPSFFIFYQIHIEEEKCHITNIYNISRIFYEKNVEGTYLPKSTINPNNDFALFLHMHADLEVQRLEE
ncbi:MAG: VCBS repeat-containing protein [Thermoplasmata archaeon]|nr:MAG: VCBS repeat-containing protein [Thermoplasmata archaeon]